MLGRQVHAGATSRRPGPQQSQQAVKLLPAKHRTQPVGSPETHRFVVRQPRAGPVSRGSVRRGGAAAKRLALADKQSAGGGRDAVVDAPTEHGPHHQTRPRRPAHLLVRGRATAENTDTTCKTAAQDPALAPVSLPRTKKRRTGAAARAPAAARAHRDLAGAGPHVRIRRPRYASEVAADRGLDSF